MSNATSSDAGRSNTTKSNKAIVIGAGVGGLSAAIALRMAGLEVTVFERHTDPRVIESGGAFILWNNAMKALGHLGLADEVEAAGAVLEVAEWQTPGGRAIASWPVAEVSREVGAPALGVRRTDLQSILVRAAGSENLRLGAQCSGYTEEADGVTVHLASGEAERCDVLVGADGIRSTVRAHVGGKGQLRDAGYWQYFGIAGCETELTTSRIFREIDGRGRRFFAFPVGRGETYWAAAQTGRGDANTRVSVGTTGAKADVLSAFAGWAEPVQTLLHATEESAIYRRQILDRDPMKAWGRGRITLLGDAAHPITPNLGQGACQAIEDAVVLARHLEGPGDLAQALRAYERSRVARTGSFVRRARMIGRMGRWRSPLSCLIRDHIAHRAIPGPALRRHRRDMAYVF